MYADQPVPKRKKQARRGTKMVDGRWRILAYQIVSVITVPYGSRFARFRSGDGSRRLY